MFVIGLTGGIGCGKSTAASILRAHGLEVLDADAISHEVTAPGGAAIPEIIERFGVEFVNADGSLNRGKMAEIVFGDRRLLDALSLIIHRHVMGEMKRRREKMAKQKVKAVVMDVPVPVKEGFLDSCDQIWVIWAGETIRLERLRGRGMPEEEALRRMRIQMSEEEYKNLSQVFIRNDGSIEELEQKLDALLQKEVLSRGIPVTLGPVYTERLRAEAGKEEVPANETEELKAEDEKKADD